MKRWHRIAMVEIIVVIVFDQLTKFLAFTHFVIPKGGALAVLPVFSIVNWWNKGISFGLFNAAETPGMQFGIVVVLTFAIVVLLLYALTRSTRPVTIAALGIVIGGALGNLVDRFHYGAVADFLYFHWHEYGFPAFNLADSCVCVGVGLLLLDSVLAPQRDKSASFLDP